MTHFPYGVCFGFPRDLSFASSWVDRAYQHYSHRPICSNLLELCMSGCGSSPVLLAMWSLQPHILSELIHGDETDSLYLLFSRLWLSLPHAIFDLSRDAVVEWKRGDWRVTVALLPPARSTPQSEQPHPPPATALTIQDWARSFTV